MFRLADWQYCPIQSYESIALALGASVSNLARMVATRPLGAEKLFPAADSDTSMAGIS